MTQHTTATAGIDTAKDKLDLAIHGQNIVSQFTNDRAGWQRLAAALAQAGVRRVGIEATGGYERGVARHLQANGFTVRLLQPLQVKAFARMRLQRAKSDRMDAILIAACTAMLSDDEQLPADPRFDQLADHLTFVEQVEDDIVRLKTRLEHISDKRLRRTVETDLKRLAARRDAELKRLVAALCRHDDLQARFELVCSVPGTGRAPRWRSSSGCPNSARSAAKRPQPWPDSPRSSSKAAPGRARPTAPADAAGCASPSTPPPCPPRSGGTRRSSPCIDASPRPAKATPAPWSPARESCSCSPTPSPLAQPHGTRPKQPHEHRQGMFLGYVPWFD